MAPDTGPRFGESVPPEAQHDASIRDRDPRAIRALPPPRPGRVPSVTAGAPRARRARRIGLGVVTVFALWTTLALAAGLFIQVLWTTYSGTLRDIEAGNRRIDEVSRAILLATHQGETAALEGLHDDWREEMRRSLVLYRTIEQPPAFLAGLLGEATGLGLFQRVELAEGDAASRPEPTARSCRIWADTPACRDYLGSATLIEESRKRDAAFLALYLLPLLWGLIGASIFVLRRLDQLLADGRIDPGRVPRYALRILLGGMLGPLVGHIVGPEALGATAAGVLPFAVAFLAGYNLEAVLARFDALATAAGGKPSAA